MVSERIEPLSVEGVALCAIKRAESCSISAYAIVSRESQSLWRNSLAPAAFVDERCEYVTVQIQIAPRCAVYIQALALTDSRICSGEARERGMIRHARRSAFYCKCKKHALPMLIGQQPLRLVRADHVTQTFLLWNQTAWGGFGRSGVG
jgi:hypothetical protein